MQCWPLCAAMRMHGNRWGLGSAWLRWLVWPSCPSTPMLQRPSLPLLSCPAKALSAFHPGCQWSRRGRSKLCSPSFPGSVPEGPQPVIPSPASHAMAPQWAPCSSAPSYCCPLRVPRPSGTLGHRGPPVPLTSSTGVWTQICLFSD